MATVRCGECNAQVTVPADLEAITMRCTYCGAQQPVPDLAARRAALIEQQREARLADERRQAAARNAQTDLDARRERDANQREARRGRRRAWLTSLIAMLVAPTIISITVFDLPARLGYGASGADRLEQLQAQLVGTGCTVVEPIGSEYASGNVSRLVNVDHRCVRVIAAGGSGHGTLALKLFASDGKEIAHASDTTDPQLAYCARGAEMLRYEIVVGVASKGRLSHMVLSCPKP